MPEYRGKIKADGLMYYQYNDAWYKDEFYKANILADIDAKHQISTISFQQLQDQISLFVTLPLLPETQSMIGRRQEDPRTMFIDVVNPQTAINIIKDAMGKKDTDSLDYLAESGMLRSYSYDGHSLLYYAQEADEIEVAQFLLKNGVSK